MNTIGKVNAAIYRNIQMLFNERLKDLDIKTGQFDFFYVISKKEGLSQKELSSDLYISKSTTAKAVKDLVKKGYVRKEKDEHDSRVDHLYLTPKGHEVAPLVSSIFSEVIQTTTINLTSKETKQLESLMNKVLQGIINENNKELEVDHHD